MVSNKVKSAKATLLLIATTIGLGGMTMVMTWEHSNMLKGAFAIGVALAVFIGREYLKEYDEWNTQPTRSLKKAKPIYPLERVIVCQTCEKDIGKLSLAISPESEDARIIAKRTLEEHKEEECPDAEDFYIAGRHPKAE